MPPQPQTLVNRLGQKVFDALLGGRGGERISYNLARIGLHGLGVAPQLRYDRSGELWLYKRAFKKLPGAFCVDVGANVGNFTSMLNGLGAGRIVAIEPVSSTFEQLTQATSQLKNVERMHCAIGEYDGEITIDVPVGRENSVLASRDIHVTNRPDRTYKSETMSIRTIDSLVEEYGWEIDILKIDVEGFELEVLNGARTVLSNSGPTLIHFEFNTHHGRRGHHMRDFAGILSGYELFRVAPRALRRLDAEHYLSNIYSLQNVAAVRRDRLDKILY
jgi:FkbM family methyltransferase